MTGAPLYCSFCGKSQHEVRKLIAGPTVFICNECVGFSVRVLEKSRKDWARKWWDQEIVLWRELAGESG